MTEIVIQIRSSEDAVRAPGILAEAFGMRFEPLFPDATGADMRSWFHLTLPGDRDAVEVVHELGNHPAVESAYVKPPESVP